MLPIKKWGFDLNHLMSRNIAIYSLRTFLASVVALLLSQVNLDYVEYYLYDLRVKLSPTSSTSGEISIVNFDQRTVSAIKSDIKASFVQKLTEDIGKSSPRLIVLNMRLEEIPGTAKEKQELANSLAKNPLVVVTTDNLPLKGDAAGINLDAPYDKVKAASAPMTVDLKVFGKDGVTRRLLTGYQGIPLFHFEIANTYRAEPLTLKDVNGTFEFADSTQTYIKYHPDSAFTQTSAIDVVKSSEPLLQLNNKLVIVGVDTKKNGLDYIRTPYNRELPEMSKAVMHANMIETLLTNSAPRIAPEWINLIITLVFSIFTVHVALGMHPVPGLIVLGSTILGFSIFNFAAFAWGNAWIGLAAPMIAVFLCYYLFIPYRLIIENRRSWEYYQKNKLLSQVEELKTNFISMMSHDLKTPIARIQGMSDVIISDGNALSNQQREAVDTIKHSSDDLLKFITAILNYGKIESQGVQLHLQSRDINNLLQEVIRKHEFLAKVKRIQIVSELEPMFPVPVDAELMKQVFSNLVENAIKYSPEDTKIMVSSEESATKVVVQVADQGPGIPQDELPNVFMKFFRSKNAKSSPIKGSGLGLYLAKYFTELHHGTIIVESSHGQGATFTVELPMEQGGSHA